MRDTEWRKGEEIESGGREKRRIVEEESEGRYRLWTKREEIESGEREKR